MDFSTVFLRGMSVCVVLCVIGIVLLGANVIYEQRRVVWDSVEIEE